MQIALLQGILSITHVNDLKEEHIALIDAGHFATEWIPFKIFGENLKKAISRKWI